MILNCQHAIKRATNLEQQMNEFELEENRIIEQAKAQIEAERKPLAHIYKAKAGQFTLILSTGAAINTGVLSETTHANKAEAKAAAKAAGATPHNY
jgi:hypothetical protein